MGSEDSVDLGSMRPARARSALAACLAVVATLGCRSGSTRSADPRVVTVASDAALLTAAVVRPARTGKPRVLVRTVAVAGLSRRYRLVVPGALDPARKYPLVFYFHGDGGDGEQMQTQVPFEAASGDSALVAYPDGIRRTWDLETLEGNRDIAFAEALVDDVARDFSIDRGQLFAVGYSSGGFFANVLACHRPSMLRAIASNAGGAPYHQAEKWPNDFPRCPGQGPVAAIALHGENDLGVTIDSGRFSAEYWAYVNGCDAGEMETTGYPECRAYRGCRPGKDVVFCRVPGLSHWVWDRAPEVEYAFFRREGMTP
jgi:polyhydroxybutyrate depolymerase